MAVSEFIYAGIICIVLALALMIRVYKGPTAADRAVAAEEIDTMAVCALILFALVSGRSIFLDIAIVVALLGFIGLVFISKYLEGSL
ncbi:MAG: monovalent cation/H+ antiporter complex subunit F [Clostridiales bacterium]|nr:monovalent cation/H+ antiporter complex subunit F [Clostridiales bacterium]